MNKEQESQQAQTIKRIGEMFNTPWGHDVGQWVANCEDLLEIVDSQAQKIAEQAQEIERLKVIEDEIESVKRMSSGVAGYHLNGETATWDEVSHEKE